MGNRTAFHNRIVAEKKATKQEGINYLKTKSEEAGVITLKSGILVEVLKESTKSDARSPFEFDPCKVTYSGTLIDGTPFDSGTKTLAPDHVILGWNEVMQLMAEGDKWRLHIPYGLAYGSRGSPPKVPGYTPLVFDVEMLEVTGGRGKSLAAARSAFEKARKQHEA